VKWFLAIPNFIVLMFLWIAVTVILIIAWFAILYRATPERDVRLRRRRRAMGAEGDRVRVLAGHRPIPAACSVEGSTAKSRSVRLPVGESGV
jgi:hypothetical protein